MGWEIKHTNKGYQIKSTISGELIHKEEWMTEQEATDAALLYTLQNLIA